GLRPVELHDQLARLVRLLRLLSAEEVGGERGEPFGGEPPGDVLDVRVEAPPLLHHHHGWARGEAVSLGQGGGHGSSGRVEGRTFLSHAPTRIRRRTLPGRARAPRGSSPRDGRADAAGGGAPPVPPWRRVRGAAR